MKARVDTGSDIAMIGAWDAQHDTTPLTAMELEHHDATLEAHAAGGRLFLVRTGGDGGGPIDLYVDEEIPGGARSGLVPVGDELLLVLPSGALVVDGAEYYRAPTRRAAERNGAVSISPGSYAVRCFAMREDEPPPTSEDALKDLVGADELSYYDRSNRRGCLMGTATLLLFPILSFPLGWKLALAVTAVAFFGFFHVRERILTRNARYRRLNDIVPAFRIENQDPAFVLQLRSIPGPGALRGGSVSC